MVYQIQISRRRVLVERSLDKAHKALEFRQACISGIVMENFFMGGMPLLSPPV